MARRALPLILALLSVALSGCDDRSPTDPGGAPSALRASRLDVAAADPTRSPLTLRLAGTGLADATLSVDPPLALHVDLARDTLVTFRLAFAGAAPGIHWIRAAGVQGRDSIAFTVDWPPPDATWTETRSLWISRWELPNPTPDGVRGMVRRAAEAGFNRIYLQVRGNGDALYRSSIEPWSPVLTGVLGGDPGWDPLAVAVDEGRLRGLQIHAWINAFTGWSGGAPPPATVPPHPFLEYPDWVMVTESGEPQPWVSGRVRWFSPGHPGVRTRLARVAAELVRETGVHGVHLDFIRYPGRDVSFDAESLAAWARLREVNPGISFDEARREFVTWAVAEVRDSMRVAGLVAGQAPSPPELTAAVWGIYRNVRGWSSVSRGFEDHFQDPRAWVALGLVDRVAPMVYWGIQPDYGSRLDFAFLADEHVAGLGGAQVEIGIDAHALTPEALAVQIERARLAGASGVAIFSLSALDADPRRWSWLREAAFRWPAGVPPRTTPFPWQVSSSGR
jgi:uncharacterized lipoprotein YddW (UPF0748 family)